MRRPSPPARVAAPLLAAACLAAVGGCVRDHEDPEDRIAELEAAREKLGLTAATPMAIDGTGAPVAADAYHVTLKTTAGDLRVRVRPDWAPLGAARFRELVESGFLDDAAFFRVLPDFVVQFGLSGDPATDAAWKERPIPGEPVRVNNTRGTLAFAKSNFAGTQQTDPDTATSQMFINLKDNASLNDVFSPFAEVVEGLDEFEANVFSGYAVLPPNQEQILQQGDAYLRERFPKLTRITAAELEQSDAEASAGVGDAPVGTEPPADPVEPPATGAPPPAADAPPVPEIPDFNADPPAVDPGDELPAATGPDPLPEPPAGEEPTADPGPADDTGTPADPAPSSGPADATPVAGGQSPGRR